MMSRAGSRCVVALSFAKLPEVAIQALVGDVGLGKGDVGVEDAFEQGVEPAAELLFISAEVVHRFGRFPRLLQADHGGIVGARRTVDVQQGGGHPAGVSPLSELSADDGCIEESLEHVA